jgi:hypothetical protein
MKVLLFFVLKIIVLLILPFVILIRGAVYMHETYGSNAHLSIIAGAFTTVVLLTIYFSYVYFRATGKVGNGNSIKLKMLIAGVLVLFYCFNGLFFLKGGHAKTEAVQKEFTSLHPILRLSISTILFVDRDLILTDASRLPEDYQKMGLPTKIHSLHYKQKNGYAHAFDVRTKNHSEFRNRVLQGYFEAMGFNTLRHFGTEDHLHVSLKSHDRPGAI